MKVDELRKSLEGISGSVEVFVLDCGASIFPPLVQAKKAELENLICLREFEFDAAEPGQTADTIGLVIR